MPSNRKYSRLHPFPIDQQVMARIRPMRRDDCERVARLHHSAMGHSLWATLGVAFLIALYQQLLDNADIFIAYVYEDEMKVVQGFIAGTIDAHLLLRTTLLKGWRHLVIPLLVGVCSHPSCLIYLITTPIYSFISLPRNWIMPESLFCSFSEELRGTRVSGHINKVFFDELIRRGYNCVKITTEASNVGSNRQLLSWGFEELQHFYFYGKKMITYTLDFDGHPRLIAPPTLDDGAQA